MVPVFIDHVDLPIEFSAHQAVDLVGWPGDENDGFYRLVADLGQRIGKGEPPKAPVHQHRSTGVGFRFGFWSIGVAVLGLWPIYVSGYGRSDDPFIAAPIVIAIGLLVLSLAKPISPRTALVFVIVPYVLNYIAFYSFFGERLAFGKSRMAYHLESEEIIIVLVALSISLVAVYAICKWRAPKGP